MRIIDVLLEKERVRQNIFRWNSYLKKAAAIIENYKGKEPFSGHIKHVFAAEKKYGSRDRKNIAALCYYYFRLGKAIPAIEKQDRILLGIFLCENTFNEILELHRPDWNSKIHLPVDAKIKLSGLPFLETDIFPYKTELSTGIPQKLFSSSHLIQPLLFLRLRKKKRTLLMERVTKSGWNFSMPAENCLALPNGTKTEEIISIDDEAVIQDYNSQQVFNYLNEEGVMEALNPFRKYHLLFRHTKIIKAWDCCAASGGKTILLYDLLQHSLKPTVSDIRLPILLNLHRRFKKANLRYYDYFVGDLEKKMFTESNESPFPIIICDAPCTGSGTWSRTPEQLYFFKRQSISEFAARQKKIAINAIANLAVGGLFFYITCSVFKQENEEVAEFIQSYTGITLVYKELLAGWDKRADTMFVAVFKRED